MLPGSRVIGTEDAASVQCVGRQEVDPGLASTEESG